MATVTQADVSQGSSLLQQNPFFWAVIGGVHVARALAQLRDVIVPAGSHHHEVAVTNRKCHPEPLQYDPRASTGQILPKCSIFEHGLPRGSAPAEAEIRFTRSLSTCETQDNSTYIDSNMDFRAEGIFEATAIDIAVLTHTTMFKPRYQASGDLQAPLLQRASTDEENAGNSQQKDALHFNHYDQGKGRFCHRPATDQPFHANQACSSAAARNDKVLANRRDSLELLQQTSSQPRSRGQQQQQQVDPQGRPPAVTSSQGYAEEFTGQEPSGQFTDLLRSCNTSASRKDGCSSVNSGLGGGMRQGDPSTMPALTPSSAAAAEDPFEHPWFQATTACAGAACRTLAQVTIYPLDTLKTRMQVRLANPQLNIWRAVMSCPTARMRALVAWAGPAGLRDMFLGLGAAVAGTLPGSTLYFASEQALRGALSEALSVDRDSAPCRLGASAAAAALSALVRVPADVIKHRVQAYAFPTSAHAARHILATRGPAGLYAGFGATLLRDAPEIVVQFSLYGTLKALLEAARQPSPAPPPQQQLKQAQEPPDLPSLASPDGNAALASVDGERCPQRAAATAGATAAAGATANGGGGGSVLEHLVVGGTAGATAALLTTPLDVAKTQLQCGAATSVVGALKQAVRSGGPAALFGGVAPRVAQTALCSAIFFALFETTKAHLNETVAKRGGDVVEITATVTTASLRGRGEKVATGAPAPAAAAASGQRPCRPSSLHSPKDCRRQDIQFDMRAAPRTESTSRSLAGCLRALDWCAGHGPLAPVAAYGYAYAGAAAPGVCAMRAAPA